MSEDSSFVNWWNMWAVFGPADRQEMLRRISLVFPDFAYNMLGHWYRHSVCSHMETMDLMVFECLSSHNCLDASNQLVTTDSADCKHDGLRPQPS